MNPNVAWENGGTIYVSDLNFDRVTRFDNAATRANTPAADGVLGQTTFTGTSEATAQNRLHDPVGVAVDVAGTVYVSDVRNNRVLIFKNAKSKANGANADGVLGQPDYVTTTNHVSEVSQNRFSLGGFPGLSVDSFNDQLWVADEGPNRVVGFQASSALPVELVGLTATVYEDQVLVKWVTISETNNAGFEIEHRENGQWDKIAFVDGQGTTLETHQYSHTVRANIPGVNAFRLKQVDYDGSFTYSAEVEVTVEMLEAFSLSEFYPNPFNSEAGATLTVREQQKVSVKAYDLLGREVAQLFDGEIPALQALSLQLVAPALPSGTYVIHIVGRRFADSRVVTLSR